MKEKITWKIEKRKLAELIAADYNPRKMTESQERDLGDSIDEFGAVVPVVINIGKRQGVIIGGHQRTRLYKERGIEEVDVIVPSRELSHQEEKRLNLRLNKNTGQWDPEKLKDMDLSLLLDVGFDDEDLQVFFDDVEMIDDDYDLNAATKHVTVAKSKPGDVYIMGNHRLMCGNNQSVEDIGILMGGGNSRYYLLRSTA